VYSIEACSSLVMLACMREGPQHFRPAEPPSGDCAVRTDPKVAIPIQQQPALNSF
jgi:hypothetical protein